MKCIVVDDEPFALDLIKGYIEKTPFLDYMGGFNNPFKGLDYMQRNHTELLFLDINMPELSGIQLIKSLPHPPQVIFTTAHTEYAAESYEFHAIDYLLKPVTYDRFLKAVNKAHTQESRPFNSSKNTVLIKSGTQVIQLPAQDIVYVEASGNYMTFHTGEKRIMSLLSMKEVIKILPEDNFVRIHKSYIIAKNKAEIIEKHQVVIQGTKIPIGVTYRESVARLFDPRKQ